MQPFQEVRSRVVVLLRDSIDTDQIIPGPYTKVTDKRSLDMGLFANWRYSAPNVPNPDFCLNRPAAQGAKILLTGDNFGCGSSREHVVWALIGFGFRAVISTSFTNIFRNNALQNGLLPIAADPAIHVELVHYREENPAAELAATLEPNALTWAGGRTAHFPMDEFAKQCLMRGIDRLGYVLSFGGAIEAYEQARQPSML
ncbi:MAG: 3-isopropylmalate dehydratase small subunit [Verrucomicrobia bacterium]|nr:3-isopropylmalate dehydratase small subunit [Verrucomicrobiota bacterium]